ncbi:AAA family ATPase [Alphaproteobacteria bacterium LSUCC0719]
MPETVTSSKILAQRIVDQASGHRLIVAIAGPPGSGKSTLADIVKTEIDVIHPNGCEIVPMDGFHYDNAILDEWGVRARKGAPHTFDVGGLAATLSRLRALPAGDVAVPVFDRPADRAYASARMVPAASQIILVEGNYLLLDDPSWRELEGLFDLSITIRCRFETLAQRLRTRWLDLGLSEDVAQSKCDTNDLPNCRLVIDQSRPADIIFDAGI